MIFMSYHFFTLPEVIRILCHMSSNGFCSTVLMLRTRNHQSLLLQMARSKGTCSFFTLSYLSLPSIYFLPSSSFFFFLPLLKYFDTFVENQLTIYFFKSIWDSLIHAM